MIQPKSDKEKAISTTIAAGVIVLIVLAAAAGIYFYSSHGSTTTTTTTTSTSSTASMASGSTSSSSGAATPSGPVIQIVAAENFWGSLVSQLAGTQGNVTSIVSDPNTDPHEYEANPADAKLIASAQLVIINGMDYDTWASQLINASNTSGQTVLEAEHIVGLHDTDIATVNPHLWYSPWYVNETVHAMYNALVKINPASTAYFTAQYASLNSSLYQTYMKQEDALRAEYGGTATVNTNIPTLRYYTGGTAAGNNNITATESIVQFFANATGLNILTPVPFMFAIAEGNDPAPADVATFEQELSGGNTTVRCLVYNIQTVMPVTQQIKVVATDYQVPITDVSETVQPPTLSFQAWQGGEVANLANCLNSVALGA
jgi:zinc/manganese transport system substrate-binding protein